MIVGSTTIESHDRDPAVPLPNMPRSTPSDAVHRLVVAAMTVTTSLAAATPADGRVDANGHALPDVGTVLVAPAPQRLFVSGHSLTDPPLPAYVAAIAKSLGDPPLQWNMQSMPGSSIKMRAGPDVERPYREGSNRDGRDMDVPAEWRKPSTVTGGAYDALLVAEQHGVLTALTYQDTANALADIHRRFTDANPRGRVWFYESWLGVDDKSDPSRWIAYERAASPVWQCVAARSSATLRAMAKPFEIDAVPSGLALATLVQRVTRERVEGISASSVRETMDRLFADDVHLTPLGTYYMASVVYATLWSRSPVGAAAPPGIDPKVAKALQQEAWTFVRDWRNAWRRPSFESCREQLKSSFIAVHWGYVRDTAWRKEAGLLSAWGRWARQMAAWHLRVRRSNVANPFRD
jgi:hypothetical protein